MFFSSLIFYLLLVFCLFSFIFCIMVPSRTSKKALSKPAAAKKSAAIKHGIGTSPFASSLAVSRVVTLPANAPPPITETSSSTSSLSSVSTSSEKDFLSNFIPVGLPPGIGIISSELQSSFKESLDVMVKMDYGSLPHEKSVEWNVALSQTCLRLSQETSLLHRQLSTLVDRNKESADSHERDEFAKSTFPLIKKQGHRLFTKVIFPSNGEVTTTTPAALTGFGLSSTCALCCGGP